MKKILTLATVMVFALSLVGVAYAADVSGKVEVKEKVCSIKVSEAKGDDGKVIADLKGKDLKVTGAKCADVEKLAGKEVEAKGKIKDNKEIDVASVAEKKAPAPKAPAPKAPAAKTK